MKKILLITLAAVLLSTSVFAQAVKLSNTTVNGAISATSQTVTLTSASASTGSNVGAPAVGHLIWFASGEAVQITAVNVGGVSTVFGIRRGAGSGIGGRPAAHATAEVVVTGPPSAFQATDAPPGVQAGDTCVVGNVGAQPWINMTDANVGLCRSSLWKLTNYAPITFNSITLTP